MKTKIEQKALETRRENPETLKMLVEHHKKTKRKLQLTYLDGTKKIIDGAGLDLQKLMQYCDNQGVSAELVKEEGAKNG